MRTGNHALTPHAAHHLGTINWAYLLELALGLEPMFTQALLEIRPDLEAPVPLPAAVHESGYYPTRYVIRYEGGSGSYRIALENFRWRAVD